MDKVLRLPLHHQASPQEFFYLSIFFYDSRHPGLIDMQIQGFENFQNYFYLSFS